MHILTFKWQMLNISVRKLTEKFHLLSKSVFIAASSFLWKGMGIFTPGTFKYILISVFPSVKYQILYFSYISISVLLD